MGRARGPQLCDFVVKHRAEPELWLSYSDSWFEFGRHSIGHCSSSIQCALKHFHVMFGKNVGNGSGTRRRDKSKIFKLDTKNAWISCLKSKVLEVAKLRF